jgi:hypothetical protein
MKIGVLYAGISKGLLENRDFDHCYPNHLRTFLESIKKEHLVELYFCSYDTPEFHPMVEKYQPKKCLSVSYENSNQLQTRINSLEMILDEDLDFVIWLRYDLHFLKKFEEWNLNFKKFNIVSKEGNHWYYHQYTNDTFFAFPHSMTKNVLEATKSLYEMKLQNYLHNSHQNYHITHMHNLYGTLINFISESDVHFMFDNHQCSGHEFNSICSNTYVKNWRNSWPIDSEVLERFS